MIVLDNQDPQDAKSSLAPVAGPTVRRPDRVFGGSTPSLVLPDYETSQAIELEALHLLRSPSSSASSIHRYKRASVRQWIPSRFWRIMFYVMILYVVLTLAIGVPLLVLVSGPQRPVDYLLCSNQHSSDYRKSSSGPPRTPCKYHHWRSHGWMTSHMTLRST